MVITCLEHLITQNYAISDAELSSIHLFEHEDRGVYKVERTDGPPLLLRACQSDAAIDWIGQSAGVLNALAAVGYTAPVVQRTNNGSTLASNGEWSGLLLTFVEGELAAASAADMQAMGGRLAQLHLLDVEELLGVEPKMPFCRWHPKSKLTPWLTSLIAAADLVPSELESRYQFCVDAVSRVLDWPDLPMALLHTDCNPQNAIRGIDGKLTFIDWDGVGFGPAILDLGYLLFYCHILQGSWPTIQPNGLWIGAILQGYLQHRPLSKLELHHLPEAIALVECHHLAKGLPNAVQGNWTQDRGLTRFYDREKIVPQLVEIVQSKLEM